MELNKQDIAERFSALPPEKQKEFLSALKKSGTRFFSAPDCSVKKAENRQRTLLCAAASLVFMAAGAVEHGVSPERRVAVDRQAGYGSAAFEF